MAQCDNGYNYILSWQPDDIVYGSEYLIGWTGKNGSKNQAIYDQSDGSYDVTFECPIMTPSPISDSGYNFSFALNITANITQCNQQLLGELNTYYNDSGGIFYRFYRLDLDYWIKNNLLNGQNTYPFIIDPCDTQYPLDIKIGSYTNIKALKNDTLLPTTAISKCENGYNYKIYWTPNTTKYGTEYLVAWTGTNVSTDREIFINTDRSYDVNFMCSTITMSPTTKPTLIVIITTTSLNITTSNNEIILKDKKNSSKMVWVTVSICLLSIIVLVIAFKYCRKRQNIIKGNVEYKEPLIKKTPGNTYDETINEIDEISNVNKHKIRVENDVIRSINALNDSQTPSVTIQDTNITSGSVPKKSIELIDLGTSEHNCNYFIGQKVLVEVKKLLHVEGTIIDIIDNEEFIIVKYDNYNNGGTEKLHVINDEHRITPLNNKDDISRHNVNDEMDVEESIIKDENESNECIICMDKPPRFACIPCGHYGVCNDCKSMINNQCPICMAKCTVVKIYKQ
eukprot:128170_1